MNIINSPNVNKQRDIREINHFLKQAFGKTTKGNLEDYGQNPLEEIDELGFIATGLPIPGFYRVVGKFTSNDGSELSVLPRFESQTKKYAQMYEQQRGKRVEITIDSKADWGTTCF